MDISVLGNHRLLSLLFFSVVSWITATTADAQTNRKTKPNILFIYVDDLGYSDLGCYGNQYGTHFIETPNLDKLAKESMLFTEAYASAPLCSPSRAALLTGKSPARLKFEFVTKYPSDDFQWNDDAWVKKFNDFPLIPPPYTLNLPLEETTLAEMLKSFGYETGIVGKWHVSAHNKVYNGWDKTFGPQQQGFDWAEEIVGAWAATPKDEKPGVFPADALTDKAISYIKEKHDTPFFLYVSHYYVHTPLNTALNWLVEKYKAKSEKSGLGYNNERIKYAAFVETLDHYVGDLLKAVEQAGLRDNTLIVFTSDNGGMPEVAFNRPFRGSKWNLYEGGLRVPMLIRYPGVIKENTRNNTPVVQTDFFPTFYELASGKKNTQKDIDGKSMVSLLTSGNGKDLENRALYWHFPYYHPEGNVDKVKNLPIGIEDQYISFTKPQSAIRKNQYKLIHFFEDDRVELFDLTNDIGEKVDLSKRHPDIAEKMKKELADYLSNVKARLPKRK
ncbi:sulfatase [Spirosoma panaciterrae]|uniref:sulfatase n=1 Tax=Spirosoma panaciterrae TaxID=496058 RepID=UPI00039A56E7|nr:sulfatase [Spirosoma panaciterrae]